jgi:hypothetical protein
MDAMPTERRCKKCGETKAIDTFVKHSACKWGVTHTCKTCDNAARAAEAPRPTDPEADATLLRTCRECGEEKLLGEFMRMPRGRYGRGHLCAACNVAKTRQWREDNPEQYRKSNRDAMRVRRAEQPDAEYAISLASAARRRGAKVVELVIPLVVLERDDGVCGICGGDVDEFDFSIDHIIACRDGGDHSYANTQVAHGACNSSKGAYERDARKAAA